MRIVRCRTFFCPVLLCGLLVPAGSLAAGDDLERFARLRGRLDIAGGTAHIPVMKEAAKRIMRFNPRIRITVAG